MTSAWFIFFFFWPHCCCMWDLSYPEQGLNCAPTVDNVGVLPLDGQKSPLYVLALTGAFPNREDKNSRHVGSVR